MRRAGLEERAAIGGRGRVYRLVERQPLGRRQAVAAEVAIVLDRDLDPGQLAGQDVAVHSGDAQARDERGDVKERVGLRGAQRAELVERRVPDPDPRIDAADLDRAELRMVE